MLLLNEAMPSAAFLVFLAVVLSHKFKVIHVVAALSDCNLASVFVEGYASQRCMSSTPAAHRSIAMRKYVGHHHPLAVHHER